MAHPEVFDGKEQYQSYVAEEYYYADMQRRVALGDDLRGFLETTFGAYLMERAEQAQRAALKELRTVDPKDADRVAELQREANIPAMIMRWLGEAIKDGKDAYEQLRIEQEPSGD